MEGEDCDWREMRGAGREMGEKLVITTSLQDREKGDVAKGGRGMREGKVK